MTERQIRAVKAILIVLNVLLKNPQEAHQTLYAADMLISIFGDVPNDNELSIVLKFLEQIEKTKGAEHP